MFKNAVMLLAVALTQMGCGGGGDGSGQTVNASRDLPVICRTSEILINGQCVNVFDDPDDPVPQQDTSSVRPRLSAGDPVLSTVTLDWMPPDESWEGLAPPFIAGYVIYVLQPMGSFYQVIEQTRLDNPGILTYVLDLPGSGSWRITVTAISTTGSESSHSNPVDVVIP